MLFMTHWMRVIFGEAEIFFPRTPCFLCGVVAFCFAMADPDPLLRFLHLAPTSLRDKLRELMCGYLVFI